VASGESVSGHSRSSYDDRWLSSLELATKLAGGIVDLDVLVYVIRDVRCSLDHPLGDAIEVLGRREDAEKFVEQVRRDDPDLVRHQRIVERKLEAGSLN